MMLSMIIGTNIGLTVGVLLGSSYQGNLFYSTIYSIVAGVLVGTTCGIILGVLPLLEGFMGGLMGGMMGAMLGEMLTQEESFMIINLLLTLSVSVLFLFPIIAIPSKKDTQLQNKKWLIKPFSAFLFLVIYLIIGNQIDKGMIFSKSEQKESHQLEISIDVQPLQFTYNPSKIVLKKGQRVSVTLKNYDSIEHDLEIKNFPTKNEITENHKGHSIKNPDLHLHAPAEEQIEMAFTPTQTGTYEFYCTIPGHKEKGMVGLIIVS